MIEQFKIDFAFYREDLADFGAGWKDLPGWIRHYRAEDKFAGKETSRMITIFAAIAAKIVS